MSTKTFPTLYKRTSTGAIQLWSIRAEEIPNQSVAFFGEIVARIVTEFGQKDGALQQTIDTVAMGKNIGRANETTPYEQACAEAQSRWAKKRDKGYVEEVGRAEAGEKDADVWAMLAHDFTKQGHKIKYPCAVQPKYDGIRCKAEIRNGKVRLVSRGGKEFKQLPHIIRSLEDLHLVVDHTLDGELYNHQMKDDFERIVHIVRQEKEPDEACQDVQYHVYDLIDAALPFHDRCRRLGRLTDGNFLRLVPTYNALSVGEVDVYHDQFVADGYEGVIVRNNAGLYVSKRSYDLLKYKKFQDAEFLVVDGIEGRGKLQGHIGAFVCQNANGQQFQVKMEGSHERLKAFFEDHSLWNGKLLTVKFQAYTRYGIPRFPVGLRLREIE